MRKFGYQGLFVSIIAMYVISAFVHFHPRLRLIFAVLFSIIVMAAIYAVSTRKVHVYIALVIALASLGVTWYNTLSPDSFPPIVDRALDMLFFVYVTVLMGKDVFTSKDVTQNELFGAVCLYLFLAFIWGFVYAILYEMDYESINLGSHANDVLTFFYYSLVTLTTLGYGDITPVSPPAMTFAALEAVIGPIYLAVLVARFVGILTSKKKNSV